MRSPRHKKSFAAPLGGTRQLLSSTVLMAFLGSAASAHAQEDATPVVSDRLTRFDETVRWQRNQHEEMTLRIARSGDSCVLSWDGIELASTDGLPHDESNAEGGPLACAAFARPVASGRLIVGLLQAIHCGMECAEVHHYVELEWDEGQVWLTREAGVDDEGAGWVGAEGPQWATEQLVRECARGTPEEAPRVWAQLDAAQVPPSRRGRCVDLLIRYRTSQVSSSVARLPSSATCRSALFSNNLLHAALELSQLAAVATEQATRVATRRLVRRADGALRASLTRCAADASRMWRSGRRNNAVAALHEAAYWNGEMVAEDHTDRHQREIQRVRRLLARYEGLRLLSACTEARTLAQARRARTRMAGTTAAQRRRCDDHIHELERQGGNDGRSHPRAAQLRRVMSCHLWVDLRHNVVEWYDAAANSEVEGSQIWIANGGAAVGGWLVSVNREGDLLLIVYRPGGLGVYRVTVRTPSRLSLEPMRGDYSFGEAFVMQRQPDESVIAMERRGGDLLRECRAALRRE